MLSARALTANNEKTKTRTNMEKMRNFILPPYPPPETYDPGFDHCRLNRGEVFLVRLIRVWPWESATTAEEKMGQSREPITVRGPLTGLPAVAMEITSTLPASPLLITVKHLPGFSKGKPQSHADQSCKVLSLARRMDVHFLRLTRCIRRSEQYCTDGSFWNWHCYRGDYCWCRPARGGVLAMSETSKNRILVVDDETPVQESDCSQWRIQVRHGLKGTGTAHR